MKIEYLSVHASLNIKDYESAAKKQLILFYSPTNCNIRDLSRKEFEQGELYHVPSDKALKLYDLVCKRTTPNDIITNLELRKKTFFEVEEFEKNLIQQSRPLETALTQRIKSRSTAPYQIPGFGWMRGSFPMCRDELDYAHRKALDSYDNICDFIHERERE